MPAPDFRIKICGVTTPHDARLVAEAGADAIGLNFYSGSKRFVRPEDAVQIAGASDQLAKVGVFVNPSREEVDRVLKNVSLDVLQFHGDETPEFLGNFSRQPVMKAFRWQPGAAASIERFLDRCAALGCTLHRILLDAYSAAEYGGTGTTADWETIASWKHGRRDCPPVVIAGGLTPLNVAASIVATSPAAVDTASGVEVEPGRKDSQLVTAFVAAAKAAFAKSVQ